MVLGSDKSDFVKVVPVRYEWGYSVRRPILLPPRVETGIDGEGRKMNVRHSSLSFIAKEDMNKKTGQGH